MSLFPREHSDEEILQEAAATSNWEGHHRNENEFLEDISSAESDSTVSEMFPDRIENRDYFSIDFTPAHAMVSDQVLAKESTNNSRQEKVTILKQNKFEGSHQMPPRKSIKQQATEEMISSVKKMVSGDKGDPETNMNEVERAEYRKRENEKIMKCRIKQTRKITYFPKNRVFSKKDMEKRVTFDRIVASLFYFAFH